MHVKKLIWIDSGRISGPFLNANYLNCTVGIYLLHEYLFDDPSADIYAKTARKLLQSVGLPKRLYNMVEKNVEVVI